MGRIIFQWQKFMSVALLSVAMLLSGCRWGSALSASGTDERIRRVANGLLVNQSILDRMEHHNVPGVSIAVVNDYELAWAKGYGVKKLGESDPVLPDTLFQAASISKPVTAAAALHYVGTGFLNLDEDVNDRLVSWHIPKNEFTSQASVTLRRLLSHTAGVNQGLNKGYAPSEDVPTMLQALEGESPANSLPVRVDRVPGTEQHYSNGGYLIVAQLLEDVTERPFSELMQEKIFGPVGMTSSTFEQVLSPEFESRVAFPHGWDMDTWQERPGLVGEIHTNDPGYSGMWTTTTDLALFGIEVMRAYTGKSTQILSQEMARLMFTPVNRNIPMQVPFDVDQGLGFMLWNLGRETWLIHFGGSFPGYISVLLMQPESGFGIAIMTNAWSGDALIWELIYSIFYSYGIFPTNAQIFGIGYSIVLFLAVLLFGPAGDIIRQSYPTNGWIKEESGGRLGRLTWFLVMFTITAAMVLTLLYRGPLGGGLVHSLNRGEPVLVKGFLGIFFSMPVFLIPLCTVLWMRRCWSIGERVRYTILLLGALAGIFLLRDLWPLMFWG